MEQQYGPFGRCIYCDRKATETKRKTLGKEHVIPRALNGTIVLLRSTCDECERIINRDLESPMLRQFFVPVRHHLRMRFRSGPPASKIFVADEAGEETHSFELPLAEASWAILFVRWATPPALLKPLQNFRPTMDYRFYQIAQPPDPRGGRYIRATEVDVAQMNRFYAKIAHAYACARFGADGFQPILSNFILGKTESDGMEYVGGLPVEPPAENGLHRISLARQDNYILVLVRLFSYLNNFTMVVVAGRFNPDAEGILPLPLLDIVEPRDDAAPEGPIAAL